MASSEILSQTLLSITQSKLSQLDKQKDAFETGKGQLNEQAAAELADDKRARILITGAESLPSMTSLTWNPLMSLRNFDRFMQQAQNDPSVTSTFILECESSVRQELDIQTTKYDYASLYGKLVNEWISQGKADENNLDGVSTTVGRDEAKIQRATWEEYVFNPRQTDEAAIRTYLEEVFESEKAVKETLDTVRRDLKEFQDNFAEWNDGCFDAATIRQTIRVMLRSDTLTDVKRSTLTDFLGNEVVLSEIADVLNMRMKTRDSWKWEGDLIIDQRRSLNGRYRFYPDEDLLQSIFLYHIGLRWAVELRECFTRFLDESVWKPKLKPLSELDQKRTNWFLGLGHRTGKRGIVDNKKEHFEEEIFLDQLPCSMEEQRGAYGSRGDAEEGDSRKSHLAVTHKLLHMIQTDLLVASGVEAPSTTRETQEENTTGPVNKPPALTSAHQSSLCKPITVIRSDFKWFGPSIPHSSITTVLRYFGVDEKWLDFFLKVLEAPLRFKQDADNVPSRTRKRGTPISTPLSDVFGEALLFCVDFAVNQKAEGARLYRLHDDMWLWGDVEVCEKSWTVLTECAKILGLDFNVEKTGSATVMSSQGSSAPVSDNGLHVDSPTMTTTIKSDWNLESVLPNGDVIWGFLKLDALAGRFIINQQEVDKHIEELRVQLMACKSIFDWIQAWNTYGVQFFSNFFGKPANCYSRQHIDDMLDTFQRIQQSLFPETPGGAGEHLRKMISERFDIPAGDIPDGYVYFPVKLGGLGLKNPFIKLCLVRDSVVQDAKAVIGNHAEEEEKEYRQDKLRFERTKSNYREDGSRYPELRYEPFMSREEYSRHRERMSSALANKYETLMSEPSAVDVELRGELKAVLNPHEWNGMSSYDKWVVSLYGREMLAKFGGIKVVEKGLLPMGMMDMLRQSKFQWAG